MEAAVTISENRSKNAEEQRADRRAALAVGLTVVVLCTMAGFSLIALRWGESAAAVAGLAATLGTTASMVVTRVLHDRKPAQRGQRGSSAATEDPQPRDR